MIHTQPRRSPPLKVSRIGSWLTPCALTGACVRRSGPAFGSATRRLLRGWQGPAGRLWSRATHAAAASGARASPAGPGRDARAPQARMPARVTGSGPNGGGPSSLIWNHRAPPLQRPAPALVSKYVPLFFRYVSWLSAPSGSSTPPAAASVHCSLRRAGALAHAPACTRGTACKESWHKLAPRSGERIWRTRGTHFSSKGCVLPE